MEPSSSSGRDQVTERSGDKEGAQSGPRSRHSSLLGPYGRYGEDTQAQNTQYPVYYPTPTCLNGTSIYCRSLMSKGHGFPLHGMVSSFLPQKHFERGVGIGDVGFIDGSGTFQYRFNIFSARDDHVHGPNLPRKFRPIEPSRSEWKTLAIPNYFQRGSIIKSDGIKVSRLTGDGTLLEFSSFAREGAVLILPDGADREDLSDTAKLYPYLREHVSDWYQYFNAYSDIPLTEPTLNGTLILVTGSDRAKVWSLAQFPPSNSQPDRPTVFRYEQPTGQPSRWLEVSWVDKFCSTDTSSEGNPCAVFLRGISFALSDSSWAHGIAPIPRDVIPFYYIPSVPVIGWRANIERYVRRYRKPPSDDVKGLWQHMFLPSLVLLQVLLDLEPTAEVAIFDDSIWCPLMTRSLTLNEFLGLFHRIFSKHDVIVSNGSVYFIPKKSSEDTTVERVRSYARFFVSGTTKSEIERKAMRKLKKILTQPPPLPASTDAI